MNLGVVLGEDRGGFRRGYHANNSIIVRGEAETSATPRGGRPPSAATSNNSIGGPSTTPGTAGSPSAERPWRRGMAEKKSSLAAPISSDSPRGKNTSGLLSAEDQHSTPVQKKRRAPSAQNSSTTIRGTTGSPSASGASAFRRAATSGQHLDPHSNALDDSSMQQHLNVDTLSTASSSKKPPLKKPSSSRMRTSTTRCMRCRNIVCTCLPAEATIPRARAERRLPASSNFAAATQSSSAHNSSQLSTETPFEIARRKKKMKELQLVEARRRGHLEAIQEVQWEAMLGDFHEGKDEIISEYKERLQQLRNENYSFGSITSDDHELIQEMTEQQRRQRHGHKDSHHDEALSETPTERKRRKANHDHRQEQQVPKVADGSFFHDHEKEANVLVERSAKHAASADKWQITVEHEGEDEGKTVEEEAEPPQFHRYSKNCHSSSALSFEDELEAPDAEFDAAMEAEVQRRQQREAVILELRSEIERRQEARHVNQEWEETAAESVPATDVHRESTHRAAPKKGRLSPRRVVHRTPLPEEDSEQREIAEESHYPPGHAEYHDYDRHLSHHDLGGQSPGVVPVHSHVAADSSERYHSNVEEEDTQVLEPGYSPIPHDEEKPSTLSVDEEEVEPEVLGEPHPMVTPEEERGHQHSTDASGRSKADEELETRLRMLELQVRELSEDNRTLLLGLASSQREVVRLHQEAEVVTHAQEEEILALRTAKEKAEEEVRQRVAEEHRSRSTSSTSSTSTGTATDEDQPSRGRLYPLLAADDSDDVVHLGSDDEEPPVLPRQRSTEALPPVHPAFLVPMTTSEAGVQAEPAQSELGIVRGLYRLLTVGFDACCRRPAQQRIAAVAATIPPLVPPALPAPQESSATENTGGTTTNSSSGTGMS